MADLTMARPLVVNYNNDDEDDDNKENHIDTVGLLSLIGMLV